MGTTGFKLLITILPDILETTYIKITIAIPKHSPNGLEATKRMMI